MLFLCILLVNIFTNGLSAFSRTEILLKVNFNEKKIGINSSSTDKEIKQANFDEILQEALLSLAPDAPELKQAELIDLVSIDATSEIKKFYLKNKDVLKKVQVKKWPVPFLFLYYYSSFFCFFIGVNILVFFYI